ncbi:MAG: S-layer homology domain-containing protein [Leptolyngbyaceae cyanobacterium SL_7_1]|nr:S-layer homology domain-containing protein [Leptolyngbyaceae cyanobacterium SL_7_1]
MPTEGDATSPAEQQTRWTTPDGADEVAQFYQTRLQENGWERVGEDSQAEPQTIVAEREGLRVVVNFSADGATTADTPFTLSYLQDASIALEPTPTSEPEAAIETPVADATPTSVATAQSFIDLTQAPEELRTYITDLAQLGVLTLSNSDAANLFKPNQAITRREYARWLVATNNRIYRDRPANKVRLGVSSSQPAFQDVARSDADFGAIQGLAEAGLIPSPLSGDANTVTFRPDAPLTREDLLLWKLPIDTRQPLPTATVQAVQQTWGFQDVARINPIALRAVLADFQNGDLSNIRRAFGFTTIFQPKKAVTRAEAAATLGMWGCRGKAFRRRMC